MRSVTPTHTIGNAKLYTGDSLSVLNELPDESVHCVVTSPPYWGLRDYGVAGQQGLEPTLDDWLRGMTAVFARVREVLARDGVLWLQMGDCWRNKQLVAQSWRLAMALQDAGWFLRQGIIWHKPSPMPETVRDRCTNAHEYLFLLSRSRAYWFDAAAFREPATGGAHPRGTGLNPKARANPPVSGHAYGAGVKHTAIAHAKRDAGRREQGLRDSTKFGRGAGWRSKQNSSFSAAVTGTVATRNRRSVWKIASEPQSGDHYAMFPRALVEPCVRAGCPQGGVVLDPYSGRATTGVVAIENGRRYIGIELNPEDNVQAATRLEHALVPRSAKPKATRKTRDAQRPLFAEATP